MKTLKTPKGPETVSRRRTGKFHIRLYRYYNTNRTIRLYRYCNTNRNISLYRYYNTNRTITVLVTKYFRTSMYK